MVLKTRSGRDFSPYLLDGVKIGEPVRVTFDLSAALLAAETRVEPEPVPSDDVDDSDDESELARPPPSRSLSMSEKAALAPTLFADYLPSCAREAPAPSGHFVHSTEAQWDGLSKNEFQKKRRRAQRVAGRWLRIPPDSEADSSPEP